jgi:transcriptional regulator with XRE-family HTH domain
VCFIVSINKTLINKVVIFTLLSIIFRYLFMSEAQQLLATLKKQLKSRGLTYRDVATTVGLSESSVKRLFASGRLTLDRFTELCKLLDLTVAELAQDAAANRPLLSQLTLAQEAELVSDPKLLLVAVCALNNWTNTEIVEAYNLSEADCLKRLLKLDRLRLINLLPGNRIRLNVARSFDWLPDGPIRNFFRKHGQNDFLSGKFHDSDEALFFVYGMLTSTALLQFKERLRRLQNEFSELHEESLRAPLSERRGVGLLLAMREWEISIFSSLRRNS